MNRTSDLFDDRAHPRPELRDELRQGSGHRRHQPAIALPGLKEICCSEDALGENLKVTAATAWVGVSPELERELLEVLSQGQPS